MEGLEPDDAKFQKEKKNQNSTHLAEQTCRRAIRRSRAGGVGLYDVGEWASTTRADERRERGRGGEDTGRQDDERARGGLEVRDDPRIRIYEGERRAADVSTSKHAQTHRRLIACGGEPISI